MNEVLLIVVVVTALGFDFTNGFHDTANAVAATISTRAVPPRVAVGFSAVLNFAGAFISLKVATTIASGIVATQATTTTVVFAALVGAIAWNLVTWWFGLPSSSSHALIGGLVGAAWAAQGAGVIQAGALLDKVVVPAILSPVLAFAVAFSAMNYGADRAGELRRNDRGAAATAMTVAGTVALAVCLALVVYSVILVTSKGS